MGTGVWTSVQGDSVEVQHVKFINKVADVIVSMRLMTLRWKGWKQGLGESKKTAGRSSSLEDAGI